MNLSFATLSISDTEFNLGKMWLATIKTAHIRMKNCTQEQIASALGITTNTLRSILKKHKNLIENETAKSID